jgi:O-antigen/teichoic acid export membrane protein
MKTISISHDPVLRRTTFRSLFQATGRVSSYFGAQVTIQLANVLAGFLLIRTLDKSHYGWFTIVTGAMAMISVLADSGLGSAFTSLGGKTFNQPGVFSGLASLVRRKRLQFLIIAAIVVLPLNAWALHRNGCSLWTICALLAMVVTSAIPSTDAVVLATVNKLFSRVKNIVAADLTLSLSKLAMIGIVCLTAPSVATATLCGLIALWLQFCVLRRQTSDVLMVPAEPVEGYLPQVNSTVAHVLPTCIFTCVQAQLATYILSFFAGIEQVADLGALMRLAIAFTFLTLPLQQIFLPKIARCQDRMKLKQAITRTMIGAAAAAIVVVILGCVFSSQLLSLLGEKYSHLNRELLVFLAISAVGFLANAAWGVAFTRAWVANGWLNIPLAVALQIAIAPLIDFSQVSGVILFGLAGHVASLVVGCGLIIKGHKHEFSTKPSTTESDT